MCNCGWSAEPKQGAMIGMDKKPNSACKRKDKTEILFCRGWPHPAIRSSILSAWLKGIKTDKNIGHFFKLLLLRHYKIHQSKDARIYTPSILVGLKMNASRCSLMESALLGVMNNLDQSINEDDTYREANQHFAWWTCTVQNLFPLFCEVVTQKRKQNKQMRACKVPHLDIALQRRWPLSCITWRNVR